MRSVTITETKWAVLAGILVLLAWAGSALASGCAPMQEQGIELHGGAIKGHVMLQSSEGTITRVDLGALVAESDGGGEVRVLAASVSVDVDLGAAQLGADIEKSDLTPHTVTLRWGGFSYRLQMGQARAPEKLSDSEQ